MKRPSFQFYPADWRNNANLRRCSPGARGVWMDVLCVLHDSDEYGIVHWPLKELASAAGASVSLLRELADKSVLKGCDSGQCTPLIYTPRHGRKDGTPVELIPAQLGPIWYSSRFVRDEYVRTIRGESSRFGADNGESPKAAPKPPFGDGSTSSSSTSSSPSVKNPPKPPRKRRGAGADAPTVTFEQLVSEGVGPQHAKDWLTVRTTKKLPLTPTAWDDVKAEAAKAGMGLDQAVRFAVVKGWGGFMAKWVAKEAAEEALRSGNTGNWWDTKTGLLDKGIELGIPAPADEHPTTWARFKASVWVKAGDGPWWDHTSVAYPFAVKLRDGDSAGMDLAQLATASIRKEEAHA